MDKKTVKVYISTYISLIAILIALLAIYFKINNIENPDKSIFKNEVKREAVYPYQLGNRVYLNSRIFGALNGDSGMNFSTRMYGEILFYTSVDTGKTGYIEFYFEFEEVDTDYNGEENSYDFLEKTYTYTLPTPISFTEKQFDFEIITTLDDMYTYTIKIFIGYNNEENEYNSYYVDTITRYVNDYAELYNQNNYGCATYIFFSGLENSIKYSEGYTEGYLSGYDTGRDNGYDSGYEEGYTEGYDTGVQDTINEGDRFSLAWLEPLFQITTDFLNIEILPGFKLIYFVTIPLFFSLIYMILKLFR